MSITVYIVAFRIRTKYTLFMHVLVFKAIVLIRCTIVDNYMPLPLLCGHLDSGYAFHLPVLSCCCSTATSL